MKMLDSPQKTKTIIAKNIRVFGVVQGVGMRPFIFHLASKLKLSGWVQNTGNSVEILIQGDENNIDSFMTQLHCHQLPLLQIEKIYTKSVGLEKKLNSFSIFESKSAIQQPYIIKDYAICSQCKAELTDKSNRRYHYPFISCTNCGPRYSLLYQYPLDRQNSTLKNFPPCSACEKEYQNQSDRRFHGQNISCKNCGPILFDNKGNNSNIIENCVSHLKQGHIVAIKTTSGYKIICDASNEQAIQRLRTRKERPHKPFAVMFSDIEHIKRFTLATKSELRSISAKENPIVLCRKRKNTLPDNICPQLKHIGACLPGSGIETLIFGQFKHPIIFTSGNPGGQPIISEPEKAEGALTNIADYFLHHNLPIENPVDDSVLKTIAGKIRPIRLAKGYAPIELENPFPLKRPVIALGAQMKNTIAIAWDNKIIISPHIGDTGEYNTWQNVLRQIRQLEKLYNIKAEHYLVDQHVGYTSHRWVKQNQLSHTSILHHKAHASSSTIGIPANTQCITFTWDGTGLGEHNQLWGGETFLGTAGNWKRVASINSFLLPGAEKAITQPWRIAGSLMWQCQLNYESDNPSLNSVHLAWKNKINTPETSSIGRLFDGAAALLGLILNSSYDGQAAMTLEACATDTSQDFISLPIVCDSENIYRADWKPLIIFLSKKNLTREYRATVFHNTLAHLILEQSLIFRRHYKINHIALCGGVFQNNLLCKKAQQLLKNNHFNCFINPVLPLNDAQISYGQIIEYAAQQNQ